MKKYGGFVDKKFLGGKKVNKKYFAVNGRSSFNIILDTLKPKKIYLPFYICEEIIHVIKKNQIKFEFYKINKSLNIKKKIVTKHDEYILVVDYFGLSKVVNRKNCIYDFSLSLFNAKKKFHPNFTSVRKFILSSYGSFLNLNNVEKKYLSNKKFLNKLENPKTLEQFRNNEKKQLTNKILYPSKYMDRNIVKTNYAKIKELRSNNFKVYHKKLINFNELSLPINPKGPLYYPLLIKNGELIRKQLIKNNIFVPILWNNIKTAKKTQFKFETYLAKNCIFLPLDQRYKKKDIEFILNLLFDFL